MKETMILLRYFWILCIPFNTWGGGLSAWNETTVEGYELAHDGGVRQIIVLENASIVFTRFYLYRGALVAEYDDTSGQHATDRRFYIVNRDKYQEFTDVDAFETELKRANLTPHIWTRWHDSQFGLRGWILFIFVVLPIPLLLPIIWVLCLISLLTPWQWQFRTRLWFVLCYAIGYGIVVLLLTFPQSV